MGSTALRVGELTAYLTVDNDAYKRGIRDARTDLNTLARDADRQATATANRSSRLVTEVSRSMSTVGRDADRKGQDAGGLLAQGMRSGFIRHSPLIAAAVGGALAAGAPLMIAGATTLFGGIGAVAAAQTTQVRSAWTELGRSIRDGAVADASVLVPVYVDMADKIGSAFEEMRPQLRDAFAAVAPQIATVTDGLIGMAENAMPGLVRAVERSGPVMDGLASLLEDVGSGLAGFFDAMSDNAPAAGQAFAAIGDILADLLPTLGELLGTGAEIASVVLPPLASALGVVADVVEELGPLLPAIVTGFIGMRVAGSVAGGVGTLATRLGEFAAQGGLGAATAGRLSGALGRVSAAAGPIGAAVGGSVGVLVAWNEAAEKAAEVSQALGRAMEVGGQQADAAAGYHERFNAVNALMNTGLGESIGSISLFGTSLSDLIPDIEQSRSEYDRWVASLNDGDRAAENVRVATEALEQAVSDYGAASPEARAAADDLTRAQEEQRRANDELEMAIDGVTSAMIEQADQALAGIDSTFNYRRATDQLEDAQIRLREAMVDGNATAEDQQRAFLDVEEASYDAALAYGQQQADLSGLSKDSAEYARIVQTQMLVKLYELRDAAGPRMRDAIQTQINALERSGVSLDETGRKAVGAKNRTKEFSDEVRRVPASKTTRLNADTATANRNVDNLQKNIDNTKGKTVTVQVRAAGRFIINPNGGLQEYGGPAYEADGIPRPGYMHGGWTGPGPANRVVGDVHADEFVVPKSRVNALGGPHAVAAAVGMSGDIGAPKNITLVHDTRNVEQAVDSLADAVENATPAVPAMGSGYVTPTVSGLFNTIKAAFPRAKLNSGFRFGDPGYHGLGRAVDLGEAGFAGGAGRPYLAQMAAWIYRNYGKQTRELIYTGLHDSTPDLKNGRVLNYGAATNAAHRNHVHWAMDTGGILGHGQSATNLSGRPERVLDPRQTEAFERAMDSGWTARGGDVHVHISGVMDLTNRQAVRRLGDVLAERIKERERELR